MASTDKGFTDNLIDLSAIVDTIGALNGAKINVKKIRIHLRIYSEETFIYQPLVVQTAGAWTADVTSANYIVDKILDENIDDVFGYQPLTDTKVSRRVPTDVQTDDTGRITGSEITIELPGSILQILNKEAETERLQNLLFGVVGRTNVVQTIKLRLFVAYEYTIVRKKLILR